MFKKAEEVRDSQKEYMRTEKWALEEEKREQEWQDTHSARIEDYICKINELLAEGTRESRRQIMAIFRDADFSENYRQIDTFAEMYVMMCIYESELQAGFSKTILEQADTIEGLREYLFQLKMILYRLDFGIGYEADKELLAFLRNYRASPVQLGILLVTSVMRPLATSLKLEKLFEKNGLDDFLFYILNFMDEHWKGNYRIILKLAKMYEDSGDNVKAERYRKRIPSIPEKIKSQGGIPYQVQEILWRAKYGDEDAEEELAVFMQRERVPDGAWEFLLDDINGMGKESCGEG